MKSEFKGNKQHLPSMTAAEARQELNGYFDASAPVTKKEKEEAAKKRKEAKESHGFLSALECRSN